MLTQEQVQQLRRDGCLRDAHVLNDEQVETRHAQIERVIRHHDHPAVTRLVLGRNMGGPEAPVWPSVNVWQASAPVRALTDHAADGAEMAQLTGVPPLRSWYDQIQSS